LEPHDQLDASAGVQLPGANTEKHVEVALISEVGAFELTGCNNVLKFSLCLLLVFTGISAQTGKDIATLCFSADFNKPSG
jgi:hypothetical protein